MTNENENPAHQTAIGNAGNTVVVSDVNSKDNSSICPSLDIKSLCDNVIDTDSIVIADTDIIREAEKVNYVLSALIHIEESNPVIKVILPVLKNHAEFMNKCAGYENQRD